MKVCNKCREEKPLTEFYKRSDTPSGYRNSCKECWIKAGKKYVKENTFGDRKKIYYELLNKGLKVCNGCGKIKSIEEYWKSTSRCIECNKKYNKKEYLKHKERRILEAREYRKNHKDNRSRLNTPQDYISSRISSAIRYSLKRVGKNKNNRKWESILGYGANELMEHFNINTIEELKGNEIDHIIPIASYSYNGVEDIEFKKCWDINNLRLIPAKENSSKKDNIDANLIRKYMIEDLLPGRIAIRHL